MDELPFVSVVIPVYNDGDRLLKCLKALYLQTYPYSCYEVIVVDNASTENIFGVCQQFPNVKYLLEAKRGSYAARNHGVRAAKGEVIAFTDSDCVPVKSWIAEGVRSLLENPAAGIVAGHIEFFFTGSRLTVGEYVDSIFYLRQEDYARSHHFGATANVFTKRSVIDSVGYFNERLVSMGDREWGQRVFASGLAVIYSPSTIVFHPARKTQELLKKARRCASGSWAAKQKLSWIDFWEMVKPIDPIEYYRAIRDENLRGWKEKVSFILLINRLKYTIAITIIQHWLKANFCPIPLPPKPIT